MNYIIQVPTGQLCINTEAPFVRETEALHEVVQRIGPALLAALCPEARAPPKAA